MPKNVEVDLFDRFLDALFRDKDFVNEIPKEQLKIADESSFYKSVWTVQYMCIVYEFYLFDFILYVLNLLFCICINQQIDVECWWKKT